MGYQGHTGRGNQSKTLSAGERVEMLRNRFRPGLAERVQGIVRNRTAGKVANEQDWIPEHQLAIQKIQGLKDGVDAIQAAREAGRDVTEQCARLSMQILKVTML